MKRFNLEVGAYDVNCSILAIEDKAWVVDPGADADEILRALADRRLTPVALLLTHGHFDHIGAIPALQKAFPALPVYVSAGDARVLTHPFNQMPPDYPAIAMPANVRDAATLEMPVDVQVLETPGHTPGGVCYYFPTEKLLLSGDTLFAGSIGRTDFPGGDMKTMTASLKKLTALPDDVTVVPGHGPSTTIAAEKRGNPFLT